MLDGCYRSAEAKLVAYLKSKGYSDEDARWIAHETLLHVWEVHGSSIDPNKLDRDLVHLIAKMVAAHDVRRVLMGEQLVSPAALPPDRIIESPEDEVIAAVDAEHAWRSLKPGGRWLGGLVAIFGLGAVWMKRITEKGLVAAGAGTADAGKLDHFEQTLVVFVKDIRIAKDNYAKMETKPFSSSRSATTNEHAHGDPTGPCIPDGSNGIGTSVLHRRSRLPTAPLPSPTRWWRINGTSDNWFRTWRSLRRPHGVRSVRTSDLEARIRVDRSQQPRRSQRLLGKQASLRCSFARFSRRQNRWTTSHRNEAN